MMWGWLKISEHARVDFQTGRASMACKRHFKSTAKVFILYVTYSELTVVVPAEPTITLQTLIKHHSNTIRSQLSNLTETFREKETFFQRKKLKFAEDKRNISASCQLTRNSRHTSSPTDLRWKSALPNGWEIRSERRYSRPWSNIPPPKSEKPAKWQSTIIKNQYIYTHT